MRTPGIDSPKNWFRGGHSRPLSVAGAVTQFALISLAVIALVGVAGVAILRDTGTDEAIDHAKELSRLAGKGIVEPALTDELLEGDPAAVARVDRAVRHEVLRPPVVRVKLWTEHGHILYSDEKKLIGKRFEMHDEDLASLRNGTVEAGRSELSEPENRYERVTGKLLEVYQPVETPGGERLLFESYLRLDRKSTRL